MTGNRIHASNEISPANAIYIDTRNTEDVTVGENVVIPGDDDYCPADD